MDRDLLEILQESDNIPTLPVTYIQIKELIDNPRSSITDIGNVIKKDSGLTARLLRLANSTYYGLPNAIDSITRALVTIGTRELCDYILGTVILSLFKGIPEDLVNMKSFWKHSIGCGLASKIVATFREYPNPERLFVAGLLHDVGRLFIFKSLVKKSRCLMTRCTASSELMLEAEKAVLGFDHTDAARVLLKHWNLPENIQEIVTWHHHPVSAKTYPVETSIIHVADIIVHSMQLGHNGERFVPPLNAQAWDILGLQPSMLPPIVDQMDRQFDEVLHSLYPESQNA
jgi:HD-like signal output (HDOD) protein